MARGHDPEESLAALAGINQVQIVDVRMPHCSASAP